MANPHPASGPPEAPLPRPPPILCLGMARTGTASLGQALQILGYPNIQHGTNIKMVSPIWAQLSNAADASFPTLPTYTSKPLTRAEWDEIFGTYDAVTDLASFFAVPLIAAYPDAKVILVEREIESWFRSWKEVSDRWVPPFKYGLIRVVGYLTGLEAANASRKFHLGWIGSNRMRDVYDKAREAYVRHYKFVRENVPKERLLDFRLEEGWGPLCEFLGKEVPEVAFPRVNDAKAYRERNRNGRLEAWAVLTGGLFSKKKKGEEGVN